MQKKAERDLAPSDQRKCAQIKPRLRAAAMTFPESSIRSHGLLCGLICGFPPSLSCDPIHELIHNRTHGLACGLTCGLPARSVTAPQQDQMSKIGAGRRTRGGRAGLGDTALLQSVQAPFQERGIDGPCEL